MGHQDSNSSVALIVGVTGMVGVALTEALKNPTALGGPWTVYGVSRHSLPPWFPSSLLDKHIMLDTLNKENTHKLLSPLSSQITHVFWVAISGGESEEVNISKNSTMLSNVLDALTSSTNSKLCHVTLQTGTKQYMGPIFDPTLSSQLVPYDAPFREDYPRLPFPNYYYALEDIVASYPESFTYSIHRSSIIIGASTRSYHNSLLSLSVYALICKRENYPFRFVGNKYSWEHFWDVSDARVLAEQQIWASVTNKAKNQAFNCTNGDMFPWKMLWKVLCDVFDVEFVPFDGEEDFDFVDFMKDKGSVWDTIVEENGLYKTKMEEITCYGAIDITFKLKIQHVCSMNKSREYGFHGYANTLAGIAPWVERLKQMKILPSGLFVGNKYSWEHFWDVSDARVLAEQQIWASVTNKAKNQAFNCTNGDMFPWKMLWKVLCDVFDFEFVPFDGEEDFDFVDFMKDKGSVWDTIVEENGLYKTKMEEITCYGAIDITFKLKIQHVCSMNKSREYGFHGYANTLAGIAPWVERLKQMKILPSGL